MNVLLLIGLWTLVGVADQVSLGDEWASWRGPEQTGVSREKNLPDKWSPDPDARDNNLIWKAPYGGRSTPVIFNHRLYLINSSGEGINEQERVMCFDADTGKLLWQHRFNVWHTDIVSVRLGWTNVVVDPETGNVYAHGTQGLFFCFDPDGHVVWQRSLTEEYGRISGYGGRVTSPIVDGELVILGMLNASWGEQARGGNRFLAMNKRTGAVVWWGSTGNLPKDTYYSVPVVAVINGERIMVSGSGDGGVYGFKVRTGEKVWQHTIGAGAVNCSPVVSGTRVYIGHGEENLDTNKQGRLVCLDASQITNGKPKIVWDRPGIKVRYCSPIIHAGRVYVCDETGTMYCVDADTGKNIWRFKYGRNAKGSPVWADDKIYVADVNARFHILKPGDKRCEELHMQFFPSKEGHSDVEINGSPAVAYGRVYFMTRDELYCIGKKDGPQETVQLPALPKEDAPDAAARPHHLQVVPGDVELDPGASTKFVARLFDDHGRFLREVRADWNVAPMLPPPAAPTGAAGATGVGGGMADVGRPGAAAGAAAPTGPPPPPLKGAINADGELQVAREVPGQFGSVTAKAEGVEGRARVRVWPRLPYQQDFEKVPVSRTPGGWVNTQGKFAVKEVEGKKVLAKLATNANPLVARANAYISKPTLSDYTIEADVCGTMKNQDMPDVGVCANRYTLLLDGNKQRVRLGTWEAVPRLEKDVDWPWKPGTWYHMKLTTEIHDGKGVIRGKVWPREQSEPEAWTVEIEDPIPNTEGSPTLYGYATGIFENQPGAEIYYSHVRITPNQQAQTRR